MTHSHDHHGHNHNHNHNHHHNHHHNHSSKHSKGLLVVLVITAFYMVAEFLGGIYANSLALTADAGHMLGDVASLSLSYFAIWLSSKSAPVEKTFGYYRAEIFAAMINGATLVFIALFIIYEAYLRMISPPEVKPFSMLVIALGGLVVNIIGAYILHMGSKENLNIKGAFLHVIGDLLGSVGAVIAGILIMRWGFYIADPIISIVIAIFILYSSVNLIKSTVSVFMEYAPSHIDIKEVKEAIFEVENVIDVHDLHVWSIDSQKISLSVHIVAKNHDSEMILQSVNKLLSERFGICHSTIQIEPEDFHEFGCPLNLH